MLTQTFCHLPGIGPKLEKRLWKAGIHSWYVSTEELIRALTPERAETFSPMLELSIRNLHDENATYFTSLLQANQHWRIFREFRDSTAYVDIETNGYDRITTIALYDGTSLQWYINGINLHEFIHDIRRYKLIVTFNGKSFDVPIIERHFREPIDLAHIDLMHVLRAIGYRGGLKRIEKTVGIDRGLLDGADGYYAVLLWQQYIRTGSKEALETLLAYNLSDVISLDYLMHMAYNEHRRLLSDHIGDDEQIYAHTPPDLPFSPNEEILAAVARSVDSCTFYR